MRAYERLLKYVKINTQSSDSTRTNPSTEEQFVLAGILCDELRAAREAAGYPIFNV